MFHPVQYLKSKLQELNQRLKGYRTLLWNFFVAFVAPAILYIFSVVTEIDLKEVLTPVNYLLITMGIKGVDTWLRMITDSPVGGKTEDLGAE